MVSVRATIHYGAFAEPLLPWKRNNTFSFIVLVDVAVKDIKLFNAAVEMQQWVPFAL
jgi:hypothetical protein